MKYAYLLFLIPLAALVSSFALGAPDADREDSTAAAAADTNAVASDNTEAAPAEADAAPADEEAAPAETEAAPAEVDAAPAEADAAPGEEPAPVLVPAADGAAPGGDVIMSPHPMEAMTIDCSICHLDPLPTANNAKLKPCPRPGGPEEAAAQESPDVFIIGELSDIYVPVVFPHKLHASMTEMGVGCEACHHHNPEGRILNCKDCHGGPSNPVDLNQPSLKGAYHRQCLACHRDWSHEQACSMCHVKRDPNVAFEPPADATDFLGMLHPNIEVPDKKVYHAKNLEDAPLITFHHKDHAEVFGLSCASCHQKENCNNCHDVQKTRPAHIKQDPHQDCITCHKDQIEGNCAFCHDTEERGPFNHEARSGFALASYHGEVNCQQCHNKEGGSFASTGRECSTCHEASWFPENFDHATIGIPLDENHAVVPCEGCHMDGLGTTSGCSVCHDDGRTTFPEDYIQKLLNPPAETAQQAKAE
ncbi:MAG: hypothetical protein IT368_18055 [Candidatus Hydrogenedentes bacterium]|nr:hypothetical protein [Candidatus Hydrogenedentota bacterium]